MKSYFQKRIQDELNISEKQNTIRLKNEEGHTFEAKIFTEDRKGNIQILLYTLNRQIIEYDHPKATLEKPNIYNDRIQTYKITRLHPDNVKGDRKYYIPKGAGTFPFIPNPVVEKFEKKEKIKTLVLTEGAFKAFKGAIHGLDIIGLTSITHYKNKNTKELHKDIIRLIKTCDIKNVIMLYDGDCRDVSEKAIKEQKDLYKRPYGFFASARNINDLLKDYDVNFYFAHIKSSEIKSKPKGLDDLLITMKGHENAVIKDLKALSKSGKYFHKINITHSQKTLQRYLHINTVEAFYDFHSGKIGKNEFVYLGTRYIHNDYENKLEVVMPANAENYFRVGNDYYERYERPNKLNDLETVIAPRLKSTITDDHGKNFLKYIAKYKDFVNVPDHTNYQRVIHNCYNSYAPFSHVPVEGKFDKTMLFLKHIFEEQIELGLDYVQLLYRNPTQKLPILCLVSKENATGKSTFAKWLQRIFSQNVTIIGNAEISNDFNAHLASKLVIAIDESFIEKKTIIEKIKNLATADSMPMNRKGKDIIEIDFFGKIILLSNNVDNFISATDEDIRYWVREIKKPEKEETDLLEDMQNEIPAFLDFLDKRKMYTERKSRAWFNPAIIRTEALQKVIEASKPKIVRELENSLKEMFMQFRKEEIYLSVKDIKELFFEKSYRTDNDYIIRTLKKDFPKVKQYRNKEGKITTKRYKIPFWQQTVNPDGEEVFEIAYKSAIGHPYVFKAEEFLNIEEYENFKTSQPEPEHEDLPF
ncbi:MAG: hypothetical protein GXO80_12065 [Chlorobi bacterium]|nr:hypothetical protein [Chlorobiota bacterium]